MLGRVFSILWLRRSVWPDGSLFSVLVVQVRRGYTIRQILRRLDGDVYYVTLELLIDGTNAVDSIVNVLLLLRLEFALHA